VFKESVLRRLVVIGTNRQYSICAQSPGAFGTITAFAVELLPAPRMTSALPRVS
jgi:hypothetical protein